MSLQKFKLHRNNLEKFPPQIAHLTTLTHLSLECSRWETLPEQIGNLTNLLHLQLENYYHKLPDTIYNLKN